MATGLKVVRDRSPAAQLEIVSRKKHNHFQHFETKEKCQI
jgi:hypothetical protein